MNEPRVFRGALCGNGNTIAGTCTVDWNLDSQGGASSVAAWFEGDEFLTLLDTFHADPSVEGCKQCNLSLEAASGTVTALVRIERIGMASAQLWFLNPEAIESLLLCE